MDFSDKIQEIALRAERNKNNIKTEEASKQSLVLPMLQALGYDIYSPKEVIPEFIADVGTKKGEKVDYAIRRNNEVIMLIECKATSSTLNSKNESQLYRYFTASDAHFGVLTNGIVYKFYTDLVKKNKMDELPFFEFDLLDYSQSDLKELKKFAKSAFELDSILANAQTLKWHNSILSRIETELEAPCDDLVKLLASDYYEGRMTQSVIENFREIVKNAFSELLNHKIDERLQSAMQRRNEEDQPVEEVEEIETDNSGIITTEEEIQAHLIVTAIASQLISPERVVMRDAKAYCAILLDDNNRKTICRLHFNTSNWKVGFLDANKNETKKSIDSLSDLYKLSDDVLNAIKLLENDS